MHAHVTGILANQVYHDCGCQYIDEYNEFCSLIRDEYEDLFNRNHDTPLHQLDEEDIEEDVVEESEVTEEDVVEEADGKLKSKWKFLGPNDATVTVLCTPDPCSKKDAKRKWSRKNKGKQLRDLPAETNENWTRHGKDRLLFERLVKKWTK